MKKNKLTTAVVAGLAGVAGIAGVSNAVHLNPEGLGQTLIYPYYTVNNGLNTTFSVVNTTDLTKAVKVRFMEGDNSIEVLDFNLYLSPYDVWVAGLVPTDSTSVGHLGEPTGAILFGDTSCVPFLNSGQQFLPFAIDASQAPFGNVNINLERSRDGHFEMIEMGTLDPSFGYGADAVHVAGTPSDCGQLQANWNGGGAWDVPSGGDPTVELLPVSGGLFGSASIIDVAEGTDVTYNAEALENFWVAGTIQHTAPGSLLPSLASGDVTSTVFANGGLATSTWSIGAEAVTAVFMQDELYNEYSLDPNVAGKTEWVITFPTKRFHVNGAVAVPPFTEVWDGEQACEPYGVLVWDREEDDNFCTVNPADPICQGGGISPVSPNNPNIPLLCWEANVVEFLNGGATTGSSAILGSTNLATIPGYVDGWARMNFAQSATPLIGAGFDGLPATGFSVQKLTNANAAPGLLAQYAGLFKHKGRITSN